MAELLFSRCLVDVEYDEFTEELTLTFHRGGDITYTYQSVPYDVYASLLNASSAGQYFNANIRDKYAF